MKGIRIAILAYLCLLSLLVAFPVAASTTGTARYSGILTITNNSTATANVTVPVSINTAQLISDSMLNGNVTDSAILSNGADVAYMPQYGTSNWWLFVPSIGASSSIPDNLYVGGGTSMSSKLRYFPGTGGMTTTDNDTYLELGGNFTIEQKGYINTAAGANKYLVSKPGAINLAVNPSISGNITATNTVAGAALAAEVKLWSGAITRAGERLNSVSGTITSLGFYICKDGSPTGTAYARVYAVSDGALLGTIGSVDVATLTGSFALNTFSTIPVTIPTTQDVYVVFEFTGGSSGTNPKLTRSTTDTIPTHVYSSYSGSYTDNAAYDADVQVVLTLASVSGISSGEHTVTLSSNTTGVYLTVDSTTASGAAVTIANNSNNWTSAKNGVMPYMEYQKIWVGGNLRQHITYQYASTFTDLSGNGQTATPTYPTTSSDADVSAVLSSLTSTNPSQITSYSITTSGSILSGNATMPSQMYTSGNYTRIPGAAVVNAFLDEGGIPRALWWYPFIFGAIILLGLMFYSVTSGGNKTVLPMCIICEVLLFFVGIINPVPLVGAFLFPIAAFAIISSQKHTNLG